MWKQGLFVLLCTALSWAGGDALFGLRWLSSPSQVRAQGVKLKLAHSNEYLWSYTTDTLPKSHSLGESYVLAFYRDSVLVKLSMITVSFTNDPYGSEGKAKFDLVLTQLSNKMKVKNKFCYVGAKLYQENDEFYQCLNYPGCGSWVAFLFDDTKTVMLQLKTLRRAEGYIVLTAEANEFGKVAERIKADKNKSDMSAF